MIEIKFKNKKQIIALLNRKQIGYLNFNYADDASKKRNIEIYYMFVEPKYRKKGIGSQMLQFLINNKPKITWISLWTGKEIEKQKAIKFYDKNGFKKIAEQKDYYAPKVSTSLFVKRVN